MKPLITALTVVIISLWMRWMMKGTQEAAQTSGFQKKLAYGPAFKLVAWLTGIVVPLGILFLAAFTKPPKANEVWIMIGLLAFFIVLGGILLVESKTVIIWDHAVVKKKSYWKGEQSIMWSDVNAVTYSKSASAFVLKSMAGVKITVGMLLKGVRQFAMDLESTLPQEKLSGAELGFRIARGELDLQGRPVRRLGTQQPDLRSLLRDTPTVDQSRSRSAAVTRDQG
jgi:hypothetical protein